MPVALSERELRDAIAVVGKWDRSGAQAAQSAFEWMGWEGEEPLLLRRYDVQLFIWYLLAWGSVMGFEEARVREQVATALEEAIESGDLVPGGRGFPRRQAEVAKASLREPWDGEDGRNRLQVVHAVAAAGWRSGEEPPSARDISWHIAAPAHSIRP